MSIALILPEKDTAELSAALRVLAPEVPVQVWPQIDAPETVQLAVVWYPPKGAFAKLDHLQAILNYGAGVDGLIDNPDVPADVELGRILLDSLHQQMTAYCLAVALPRLRGLPDFAQRQLQQQWRPELAQQATVGLLGYGYLGRHLAANLRELGYPVMAWSRSQARSDDAVQCVTGEAGLNSLVSQCQTLICMLPLTPQTRGLLNQTLFAKMPEGSHLINVARGAHLVEDDLLEALAAGRPAFATLDVFDPEPLPAQHPFWRHPQIQITPHIASLTIPLEAAGAVVRNYRRITSGHGVDQPVNRGNGY